MTYIWRSNSQKIVAYEWWTHSNFSQDHQSITKFADRWLREQFLTVRASQIPFPLPRPSLNWTWASEIEFLVEFCFGQVQFTSIIRPSLQQQNSAWFHQLNFFSLVVWLLSHFKVSKKLIFTCDLEMTFQGHRRSNLLSPSDSSQITCMHMQVSQIWMILLCIITGFVFCRCYHWLNGNFENFEKNTMYLWNPCKR